MRGKVLGLLLVSYLTAVVAEGVQPQEQPKPVEGVQLEEQSKLAESVQQEEQAKPNEGAQQNEQAKSAVVAGATDIKFPEELSDRNRFFAGYTTTTYTDVVMVTSTVFFSCLSGTTTNTVCQGRRRKKDLRMLLELPDNEEVDLAGSEDTEVDSSTYSPYSEPEAHEAAHSNEKIFLTLWTTTRTTTTVTMLYTDTRTTIRLSYFCLAGQIQLPIFRCAG
nr:uncharacterized protein LOC128690028 [Cherax quadricarinatus]